MSWKMPGSAQTAALLGGLFVALAVVASTSEAQTYTVILENGETYETRYAPIDDEEGGVTRLLTDVGNWISVVTSDVAVVEMRENPSGFGHRLDTTPRFLGWILIEDRPIDTKDAGIESQVALPEQDSSRYSIEHFLGHRAVDPGETTGIPLDWRYGFDIGYFEYFDCGPDPGLP
jgi:hypothetical protein